VLLIFIATGTFHLMMHMCFLLIQHAREKGVRNEPDPLKKDLWVILSKRVPQGIFSSKGGVVLQLLAP